MSMLKIQDLTTYYYTRRGVAKAVDHVNLDMSEGEVLCLVGESGCGKTTVGLSMLRLVPHPGRIVGGRVIFKGQDLLKVSPQELNRIRGRHISMIFQDPRASLDPVYTIGSQIDEAISLHLKVKNIYKRTIDLLKSVGIPAAEENRKCYPFEFSEGMCQRVMSAIALSCNPDLMIADEPTTNLDATIESQFLRLLNKLMAQFKTAVLYITHNFGIVREICDRVAVMYAGKIIEEAPTEELLCDPKHPYTSGLVRCAQLIEDENGRLNVIPGRVPALYDLPSGCIFNPRCDFAIDKCKQFSPPPFRLKSSSGKHTVRCFLYQDERQ